MAFHGFRRASHLLLGVLVHLNRCGAFNPQAIPDAKIGGVCRSVYPHDYVKTNTVFEVTKSSLPQHRALRAEIFA